MTLTALRSADHDDEPSVVSKVARLVEELASVAGAGCLVEAADGRLLNHHLNRQDVPAVVVQTLVSGKLRPVEETLVGRRATACLRAGPLVEGTLGRGGAPVGQLALREGVGTVWLLLAVPGGLDLAVVDEAADRLRSLLIATWDGMEGSTLRDWLDGSPGAGLPEPFVSTGRLWLVATSAATAVARSVGGGVHARACGGFVLLGTAARLTISQVCALVERALPAEDGAVVVDVDRHSAEVARDALEAARGAAPPGRCAPLASVRSAVVVRRVGQSLSELPDLCGDPLTLLDAYDGRRGSQLVLTLRAWLDGCGDSPAVAQELGVHTNTLRYRLGRIEQITGIDLRHDPLGRLELHARLVAR